jgi:hypothetical protein
VTFPRFRQHRSPGGRAPVFDGDFPGGDRDITEVLDRADWDGTTITFGGASGIGLGPYEPYPDPDPDVPQLRRAIETTALAERGTGPRALLRALPPAAGLYDAIARDMAHGWPHLFEVRCQFPAAASDTPIPCDSVHRDPAALSFRGLRASAFAAGWHLDALGRMACPHCCQDSPAYRTLYPVITWDPDAAEAEQAGDWRAGSAYRAAAEHDLFRSVRDARARHAGGPR